MNDQGVYRFSTINWTLHPPQRNDWRLIIGYWALALWIIFFINQSDEVPLSTQFLSLFFTMILDTSTVLVLVFFFLPTFMPHRQYWQMLLITAAFLFVMAYCYREGHGWVLGWDKPTWNFRLLFGSFVNHLDSYAFLAILLLGKRLFEIQRKFLTVEKEKRENELRMLKAQVDPHFLFNNLNILDALIPKEPALAQQFLRRLSGLYRYLLRHKDEEVVLLEEEWQFARDYVFLLQQRFGNAYRIEFFPEKVKAETRFLPPGALQTVIENVVKHNAGHVLEPVQTEIRLRKDRVEVKNTIRKKTDVQTKNGLGLVNLKARYALLTDELVTVQEDESSYIISLPVLQAISQ